MREGLFHLFSIIKKDQKIWGWFAWRRVSYILQEIVWFQDLSTCTRICTVFVLCRICTNNHVWLKSLWWVWQFSENFPFRENLPLTHRFCITIRKPKVVQILLERWQSALKFSRKLKYLKYHNTMYLYESWKLFFLNLLASKTRRYSCRCSTRNLFRECRCMGVRSSTYPYCTC